MNLLILSGKKSEYPNVSEYSCYIRYKNGSELKIFNQLQEYFIVEKWFEENSKFLKEEKEPKFLQSYECFLSSLEKFYDNISDDCDFNEDVELDSKLDIIDKYRTRHDLGFAFRGTDINDVIIGIYNGDLTICWIDENQNIQYEKIGRIEFEKNDGSKHELRQI